MSVRATSWAWEKGHDGTVKDGKLLTLLRVADHADNDGVCWPGEDSLAEYTGHGVSTVRGHLAAMEEMGLLRRERRAPENGKRRATNRILLALDPGGSSEASTASSEGGLPPAGEQGTNKGTVKNRKKVNSKTVSEDEYTLAAAVVSSFNSVADTAFTADANLTPIVGRIRERPDLTADNHRFLIEAVWAGEHWWTGPPSPKVIYGNPQIFEQSVEIARAAARKNADPASKPVDLNEEMRRTRREQGLED